MTPAVQKYVDSGMTEIDAYEKVLQDASDAMEDIMINKPSWVKYWNLTVEVRKDGTGMFPRFDCLKNGGTL